jgi:hypothetical protein
MLMHSLHPKDLLLPNTPTMLAPKSRYGLAITTYEQSDDPTPRWNPVLTHTFWGNTLDQAVEYAKSHLITDKFFRASFSGSMPWKGGTLVLANTGEVIAKSKRRTDVARILQELDTAARPKPFVVQVVEALGLGKKE